MEDRLTLKESQPAHISLAEMIDEHDPWYTTDGVLHRARQGVIKGLGVSTSGEEALQIQWAICVLDRAFWQCFQYATPDLFAPYLSDILYTALREHGDTALHMAAALVREKAMILAIPERDW